jgi:outer membrane lipoprotein-sorting protein
MVRNLDNRSAKEYLVWVDSNNLIPLKLQRYYEGNFLLSLEYQNHLINYIPNDDEFSFTIPCGASEV